jgi:hypothetical protein
LAKKAWDNAALYGLWEAFVRLSMGPDEANSPEDMGPFKEELLAALEAHPPIKRTRDKRGKLIQR